ncbi:hypothetical protein FACS1894217_01510 [Clostridia bacterium]|nr:hypothetical protein FACS1894217_01510 [Clostridia bacterium]
MPKSELRAIDWINKNLFWISLIVVLLLSVILRILPRHVLTGDSLYALIPWADALDNGGIRNMLANTSYNYDALYAIMLWLFHQLPFSTLTCIKLMSVVFDYGCAAAMALAAYNLFGKQKFVALLAFTVGILNPLAIINSAAWAQCDIMYTFFSVLAMYMLARGRYIPAFVFLGLNMCFKLQAWFLIPVFVIYYFTEKKFSLWYFLIPLGVFFGTGLLMPIWGGSPLWSLQAYGDHLASYSAMVFNYPNIYALLHLDYQDPLRVAKLDLTAAGAFTTLLLLGSILVYMLNKKLRLTRDGLFMMAAFTVLLCVFFMPRMHERYAFAGEMLLLLLCATVRRPRLIIAAALTFPAILTTYLRYMLGVNIMPLQLAALPVLAGLILLGFELFKADGGAGCNRYLVGEARAANG